MELKAETGKVSKLQRYNLNLINEAKGRGWIVYPANWELVKSALIEISRGETNVQDQA